VSLRPTRGPGERPRSGWFGRLLLPAFILQSVLIGGGYATGREVVEYGAKHGPAGWWALGCIFLGFAVIAVLTFEFARIEGAYEYKTFVKGLIGPLSPAFDLLFAVMAVVVIAVMISAATSIAGETLGVGAVPVTLATLVLVGLLTFFGSRYIERFKIVGTLVLYLAYLLFAVLVLGGDASSAPGAGASPSAGLSPPPGGGTPSGAGIGQAPLLPAVASGVLYVGYNMVVFPTVLFTLHRQRSRRDSVVGGLVAGLLMTLPFLVTYLCVMKFYPAPEVLEAPVPWLPMLERSGGETVVLVFGVVMAWTLLETSVGLIHAILERVDVDVRAAGAAGSESEARSDPGVRSGSGSGLSRTGRGLLGTAILLLAVALSKVGIISLVAKGYTAMAVVFLALYAAPLLTVGVKRVRAADSGV